MRRNTHSKQVMMCAFDADYCRHGGRLVRSFLRHNVGTAHCLGVNCTPRQRQQIETKRVCFHAKNVLFTNNLHKRCYMASYRFYYWGKVLARWPDIKECVALDSDALVTGSLTPCFEILKEYDILFNFNHKKRGSAKNAIIADCMLFKNNDAVRRYFQRYDKVYQTLVQQKGNRWYNDQRALYLTYKSMQSEVKFGEIPEGVSSVKSSALIQQFRGSRKK